MDSRAPQSKASSPFLFWTVIFIGVSQSRQLVEKVVVALVVVGVEFVGQLAFDIGEYCAVLLLGLVGLERLFGFALHFECPQIPRPEMFGAGQNAPGYDAGFRQWLLHMGAYRRNSAESLAIVHHHDRNSVDVEFFYRILRELRSV